MSMGDLFSRSEISIQDLLTSFALERSVNKISIRDLCTWSLGKISVRDSLQDLSEICNTRSWTRSLQWISMQDQMRGLYTTSLNETSVMDLLARSLWEISRQDLLARSPVSGVYARSPESLLVRAPFQDLFTGSSARPPCGAKSAPLQLERSGAHQQRGRFHNEHNATARAIRGKPCKGCTDDWTKVTKRCAHHEKWILKIQKTTFYIDEAETCQEASKQYCACWSGPLPHPCS
jgi:hypothetical protein